MPEKPRRAGGRRGGSRHRRFRPLEPDLSLGRLLLWAAASSATSLGQVQSRDKGGDPYYVPQCVQGWRLGAGQVHVLMS